MDKEVPLAKRQPLQPVIIPRTDKQFWWEKRGTFNPGVCEYQGKVVLLYRAYDNFFISRLGLGESNDGINFDRHDLPVIDTNPDDPYERLGLEDPRITKVEETYYIVHTNASYKGVNQVADVGGVGESIPWRIRLGMHSTQDFKSYKNWGVILPEIPAKNGCLLPEKINGAFGLYYREHQGSREILNLALTHDFKQWFNVKKIEWPTAKKWQSFKFGLGSQPLVTREGLLMVYHAVDRNQVYRLGLMLFDRHDPTHLLWHSNAILEPEELYEKEGYVPNVVYSCGAIIRDAELWIYYGAADRVIGRAVLSLAGIV